MMMGNKEGFKSNYLEDSVEWEEVSMTKALKMWANNDRHVRCVVGETAYYYYHGQGMEFEIKSKTQVNKGKWYVEKM